MRKELSSGLTFVYKFVIPTLWTLVVVLGTIFAYLDSKQLGNFLMLLMILPILLFIRLKKVSFDKEFIYVSNWRTETTYELSKIKSINERDMSRFSPWFELEIRNIKGETEKIDFMPRIMDHMRFRFSGRFTGRLLELKTLSLDERVDKTLRN